MTGLIERVEHVILSRGLLERGEGVLAAVSGGVDSMVLLHVLHELTGRHGWRISVAHLNHRLRGRSSDADQQLVFRVTRKLKVRLVTDRIDIRAMALERKVSIEMAARDARHQFLASAARRLNVRRIALAHHADDQVELFFLRLFRGSGSEGLAGMKVKSPSPADPGLDLIRPLLDVSKADLVEFATERKIPFREDATNASLDIQRNRIRHELLPLLRSQYQPGLDRAVLRAMDIAREESACISDAASTWLSGRTEEEFQKLPPAIQRRVIQAQLMELGIPAGFEQVERLRLGEGRAVSVGPAEAVRRTASGKVERVSGEETAGLNPEQLTVELGRKGAMAFGGLQLDFRIRRGHGAPPAEAGGFERFDANAVGASIVLRHWQPGDRFQPIGMESSVKLQDLFVNQKVPRAIRHNLVVAQAGNGRIFWVEGLRVSEEFKLSPATKRVLEWRWRRVNPTVAG